VISIAFLRLEPASSPKAEARRADGCARAGIEPDSRGAKRPRLNAKTASDPEGRSVKRRRRTARAGVEPLRGTRRVYRVFCAFAAHREHPSLQIEVAPPQCSSSPPRRVKTEQHQRRDCGRYTSAVQELELFVQFAE
jgi:hypothetical protein